MNEEEDLLKKLRHIIKEHGIESFHLLEDLIPIEEQMEFFNETDRMASNKVEFDVDEEIVILFSSNQPIKRKKKSLLKLSSIPDVQAYRAIETYHSSPQEPELLNWSSMALLGSRLILSSNLSGQQQIFISSGLGGYGKKLRFFCGFISTNSVEFNDLQREIIDREFKFQFENQDIDIEHFNIYDKYFTTQILVPIDSEARLVINDAIEEVNKYGGFLETKYLFTNVRIYNQEEIYKIINKKING